MKESFDGILGSPVYMTMEATTVTKPMIVATSRPLVRS